MSEPGQGTDESYEDSRGRIALWLAPEHVEWLANNCICGSDPAGNHTAECVAIRFRAGACLHAYGLERKKPKTSN